MTEPNRPQVPGYLANLMARLFHEVSGEGQKPLGMAPAQFPILVELWAGSKATRKSLRASQEMGAEDVDALVAAIAEAGLIEAMPADENETIRVSSRGMLARSPAIQSAMRANAIAESALSKEEMATFIEMMNRVIDALQAAKR